MSTSQAMVGCLALSPVLLMVIVTAAKVIASIVRDRRCADQT